MKNSIPMVAGLIVLTTSFLSGCASTSSPTAATSSTAQSTKSSAQTATTSAPPTTSTQPTAPTQPSTSTQPTATNGPNTDASTRAATCQTQHLTLTQGSVGAAAGSTYITYYLQNRGPATCSMLGYPGFSLLFANGSVIQRPATRDRTATSLVQLKPGQRAKFVVRSVDASIAGSGCSTSWKTARVQVYLPNQTIAIREPSTISACDLSVGPVSAA